MSKCRCRLLQAVAAAAGEVQILRELGFPKLKAPSKERGRSQALMMLKPPSATAARIVLELKRRA